MKRSRQLAATLAALTSCASGIAETLEDAWAVALATDQSVRAVRSQTMSAEASLAAAKSNRYPVLDVGGAFTQLDKAPAVDLAQIGLPLPVPVPGVFSDDNFVTGTAQVSIPLYTSGLIASGIDAARADLDAHRGREAAFVQDTKLAVAEVFVAVLRGQRAVDVATANVTSLESHAADVDNMYRKGVVPQNDLLAVAVSLADARQSALKAQNALDIASAAYNRRLGRDLGSRVALDEVMPRVAPAAMAADIGALTATALASRTELEALSARSAALARQAQAERARTKPQLAASAGYTFLENESLRDERFASVGIGFTWSPFDSGRTRHRASALARQSLAVTQQRDDLITIVRLQVRSGWLDSNEARNRLTVTERAIAQAEENLRVAKNRYRHGIGTNTEVLDAETLRALSRSNHNNARYDAALARLRLARAIGVL